MATYRTVEGDVLDELCWRHYGREDMVYTVLKANPGLADLNTVIPTGTVITLPELAPQLPSQPKRLYD